MSDNLKTQSPDDTTAKEISKVEGAENLIVNNFVAFFEPLINNLDANVESLR